MNDQQLLRYSRHILLDEIGIEGQEKILAGHVLVIGAGGLGSPAAYYLASAGVGTMTLVDHDTVDLSNLQRQILHTTDRIGQAKADSAKQALRQINPEVHVIGLAEKAENERLGELIAKVDVVLDCSDNFSTRHAVNRACVIHRVPLVSGAALKFGGQISVFDTRDADSPCYACLFSEDQHFEEVLCSAMGVFSPLVGIIGAMQAAEALKLLMGPGVGASLTGRLQLLDALTMEWSSINIARNATCAICHHR